LAARVYKILVKFIAGNNGFILTLPERSSIDIFVQIAGSVGSVDSTAVAVGKSYLKSKINLNITELKIWSYLVKLWP
jgi:hypothetical protein